MDANYGYCGLPIAAYMGASAWREFRESQDQENNTHTHIERESQKRKEGISIVPSSVSDQIGTGWRAGYSCNIMMVMLIESIGGQAVMPRQFDPIAIHTGASAWDQARMVYSALLISLRAEDG